MYLIITYFYTISSLINPKTAIFNPNSFGITLGIITPGVSTINIKGFYKILNPLIPLVVHTDAVALEAALLFYKSDILLI